MRGCKYAIFSGYDYYPEGGMKDFVASFTDFKNVLKDEHFVDVLNRRDWIQFLDIESGCHTSFEMAYSNTSLEFLTRIEEAKLFFSVFETKIRTEMEKVREYMFLGYEKIEGEVTRSGFFGSVDELIQLMSGTNGKDNFDFEQIAIFHVQTVRYTLLKSEKSFMSKEDVINFFEKTEEEFNN